MRDGKEMKVPLEHPLLGEDRREGSGSTRAEFLRAALGAGAGMLVAGSLDAEQALAASARAAAAASGTLNIYSWPNYFSTKNLKAFTKQTGVKLNISTYESNDALFAKLNTAGGASFDIVVPTSGWIQEMAK